MKQLPRKTIIAGMISGASILVTIFFSLAQPSLPVLQQRVASAEEPQFIAESPIDSKKVLKIKSIEVSSKHAEDNDIDLLIESNPKELGLLFKLVNNSPNDKSLAVDGWQVHFAGAVFGLKPESFVKGNISKADTSQVLREITLVDHADLLAEFPGIYTAALLGYNDDYLNSYQDQVDAGLAPEKEQHELASYSITAKVIVGFDENAIDGHILEAENSVAAIAGNGDPFMVEEGTFKNIIIYIRNDENQAVSGKLHSLSRNTYSVEHTKAAGSDAVFDYVEGSCEIIEPGKTKMITNVILDKNKWPLGGDVDSSLSKQTANDDVAAAGKYIVKVNGGTIPCSIDGKTYPGIIFDNMVVVEVK